MMVADRGNAIAFSGYPENYRRTRFEEERTRIGDRLRNKDFPAVLAFEALLDSEVDNSFTAVTKAVGT